MSNEDELDKKIDNIRNLLQYQHDYENCIIACEKLFSQLTKDDDQFYFWACMHGRALSYRKLNNIDKSVYFANIAMTYDEIPEGKHISTVWLIADNYVSRNMSELAIPFYLSCTKYYKQIGLKRLRTSVLFNMAKSKNKHLTMIKLLKIMEQDENFTYKGMLQSDIGKYNLLIAGYREFIENCLQNNCYKKYIFSLLNSINDNKIKAEVRNMATALGCF